MSITLTKKYAEIVDDTLTVLLKDYEKPNMQTYDMVRHAIKGKDNKPDASGAELIAAFAVASTYFNTIPYQAYTIDYPGSVSIVIGKTNFTEPFLLSGGLTAIWQKEEEERIKLEETRQSIIGTNRNSRIVVWVAVFISLVSAILNYTKKDASVSLEIQRLQKQMKEFELRMPTKNANSHSVLPTLKDSSQ